MKGMKKELLLIFSLLALAIASRLLPHPPNFAPITGIALFSAMKLKHKWVAYVLPIFGLFLTDLVLGFSTINLVVYFAFILISFLGHRQKKIHLGTVLISSILFFVISNLGVWLLYYPLSIEGFITCFTLAVPFFTNTLAGDLVYTAVLFFSFSSLKKVIFKLA